MGYTYDMFKIEFPHIASRVVEYEEYDNIFELVVTEDNGARSLFDARDRTIRSLPRDPNNMTDEEFRREFSKRMIMNMRRAGVGQEELSHMTGISQSNISKYKNGTVLPKFDNMDKIARALKCSTDDFRYR